MEQTKHGKSNKKEASSPCKQATCPPALVSMHCQSSKDTKAVTEGILPYINHKEMQSQLQLM